MLSWHPNAVHHFGGGSLQGFMVLTSQGHLPHCANKHSISSSWRPVTFAGAVALKILQPFSARFLLMGPSPRMCVQ